MHTTAIEAMRLYCVYAGTFGATKKKEKTMKLIITILLILNFGVANSQDYKIGDSLLVNSNGGLNIRKEANTNSKIIGLLNFGERVFIEAKTKNEKLIKIGLMNGNWVKVKTNKYEGFIFDAYISKLPQIKKYHKTEFDEDESCFMNTMKEYIFKELIVIDTTNYNNCADGEGAHSMRIYELKGGHQFIEHGYWESYQIEFQLNDIRDNEGIQLVKNLFQSCGQYSEELEKKITTVGIMFDANMGEFCCNMVTERFGNKFIIRLMGGP